MPQSSSSTLPPPPHQHSNVPIQSASGLQRSGPTVTHHNVARDPRLNRTLHSTPHGPGGLLVPPTSYATSRQPLITPNNVPSLPVNKRPPQPTPTNEPPKKVARLSVSAGAECSPAQNQNVALKSSGGNDHLFSRSSAPLHSSNSSPNHLNVALKSSNGLNSSLPHENPDAAVDTNVSLEQLMSSPPNDRLIPRVLPPANPSNPTNMALKSSMGWHPGMNFSGDRPNSIENARRPLKKLEPRKDFDEVKEIVKYSFVRGFMIYHCRCLVDNDEKVLEVPVDQIPKEMLFLWTRKNFPCAKGPVYDKCYEKCRPVAITWMIEDPFLKKCMVLLQYNNDSCLVLNIHDAITFHNDLLIAYSRSLFP